MIWSFDRLHTGQSCIERNLGNLSLKQKILGKIYEFESRMDFWKCFASKTWSKHEFEFSIEINSI